MNVTIVPDCASLSTMAARLIAQLVRAKPDCNLGLATGRTPIGVYAELVRMHRQDGLSLANVVTFNLDEYYPMPPHELQSYRRFMNQHLFAHVDIDPANVHIPDGTISVDEVPRFCEAYEQAIRDAGGIDLQLLGIGRTGHVGFNEPGSRPDSRTRLVWLDQMTRMDAACDFSGIENVPKQAITMGVGTILAARQVILMASGDHKAGIVGRSLMGPVSSDLPASFLREHPMVHVVLDSAAASHLTSLIDRFDGVPKRLGLSA